MPPKTEEIFTEAMMWVCLFILFSHFGETTGYGIRPDKNTTVLMEDTNITLSCLYEGSIDSLHWYQQKPGSRPEFLIMIDESSGYVTEANPPYPRLSIKRDQVQKRVSLEISSAAVTDSAMYYCALRPYIGNKIVFGKGTQLVVTAQEKKEPNIFKIEDSCLATDFTDHEAVKFEFEGKNVTPVRYTGQNYYSSFNFQAGDDCEEQTHCVTGGSSSSFESDEKSNYMLLGLYWLRILFLKTVVFNVLITFKAWMS